MGKIKEFIKSGDIRSGGLVAYFFLCQIISSIFVVLVKIALDTDWLFKTNNIITKKGLFSAAYFESIVEITYPALILADIMIVLPIIYRKGTGFIKKTNSVTVLNLVCFGIMINFTVSAIVGLLPESTATNKYNELINMVMVGSPIVILLCMGILAPIVEELVFRYGIFELLGEKSDTYKIVASALWFGLAHFNIIQSSYAFVIGLVLGWIYSKNKNLVHTIIIHIVINYTSLIYEWSNDTFRAIAIVGTLVAGFYYLQKVIRDDAAIIVD